MTWIYYALLSYALVGGVNILDKVLLDKYIKDSSTVVIFTGTIAGILGILLFVIRGFPIFSFNQTILILLSGIFFEWYLLPYFKALETNDASSVTPLFQAIPIFTLFLSYIFLHETLTFKHIIGFMFILGSGYMLSINRGEKIFRVNRTFFLMMISSFMGAVAAVLFKFVLEVQNFWDSLAYESLGIGVGTLLIFLLPGYAKRFFSHAKKLRSKGWIALSISETLYVSYRVLIAKAYSLGPLALINVMSGFQSVFVLCYATILTLLAPHMMQENITKDSVRRKLFAVIGIFIGLYFLYI